MQLAPNTLIQNRYLVKRQIGQGGMGAIYKATDQRLGNTVALKQMLFSDAPLRSAFEREARLLANLRHLSIPRVIDHFTDPQGQFLVMDYIPGPNLHQKLSKHGSALPLNDVLQWAEKLLEALEYLHNQQPPIIHRDIKPQNIKVLHDGQVILLDFGLAKGSPAFQTHMLSASSLRGYTVAYAPLEQINGTGTTSRSDLYSLGSTLYHLLSGAPPPAGANALTRAAALFSNQPDPLRPLYEINPDIPVAVSTVIMQALELQAESRPASATDMRTALHQAFQKKPTQELLSTEPSPDKYLPTSIPSLILKGHTDSVLCVACSPHGRLLASGSRDGTIRLWNLASQREVRQLQGHTGYILSLAFSPDGCVLASGSVDKTIRLWDIANGKQRLHITNPADIASRVWSVAFSPDGDILATGSGNNLIQLWDVASGQEIQRLQGHTSRVHGVAFSPDNRFIASGGGDLSVCIWDRASGQVVQRLVEHALPVYSVAFNNDGRLLASGSEDGVVRLWHVDEQGQTTFLQQFENHTNDVISVAFSPDGAFLASGSLDKTIRLWHIADGRALRQLESDAEVVEIAFSPDGQSLTSAHLDKTIRLWKLHETGAEGDKLEDSVKLEEPAQAPLEQQSQEEAPHSNPDTMRVSLGSARRRGPRMLSPDAVSSSSHPTVALPKTPPNSPAQPSAQSAPKPPSHPRKPQSAPITTHKEPAMAPLRTIEHMTLRGHKDPVWSVAFSTGKPMLLASASGDQTICLWDVVGGNKMHRIDEQDFVYSVAFSPDKTLLAIGSNDRSIHLREVKSGREVRRLKGHSNYVQSVAFSPNGNLLASASYDSTVRLWDVQSGRMLYCLSGHKRAVYSVAFSPKGDLLASAGEDNVVRLWDTKNGDEVRLFSEHSDSVRSVAFSPNGKWVASGSNDHVVWLWNVRTGKTVRRLERHLGGVYSVAFSADGRFLASGSNDYTLQLWEMEGSQGARQLEGHTGVVQSVAFSPDNSMLASGSYDRTIRIWRLDIADDTWQKMAHHWR